MQEFNDFIIFPLKPSCISVYDVFFKILVYVECHSSDSLSLKRCLEYSAQPVELTSLGTLATRDLLELVEGC